MLLAPSIILDVWAHNAHNDDYVIMVTMRVQIIRKQNNSFCAINTWQHFPDVRRAHRIDKYWTCARFSNSFDCIKSQKQNHNFIYTPSAAMKLYAHILYKNLIITERRWKSIYTTYIKMFSLISKTNWIQ